MRPSACSLPLLPRPRCRQYRPFRSWPRRALKPVKGFWTYGSHNSSRSSIWLRRSPLLPSSVSVLRPDRNICCRTSLTMCKAHSNERDCCIVLKAIALAPHYNVDRYLGSLQLLAGAEIAALDSQHGNLLKETAAARRTASRAAGSTDGAAAETK